MSNENQNVSQEIAEVFRVYYEDPTNTKCMDCNADAREWVSVNNAVSLCSACAAAHSHLNEHTSVPKSVFSPDWEWKDLMLIRNGGNLKFQLFMNQYKFDPLASPLSKYKTKAAFFYRRKLRHICEGKPEPKAIKPEEAMEEVEHDNFLDKIADFFTGIFSSEKKEDENIEAHPGPLREETQAQGLLAPRIVAGDGLKEDSFREELLPEGLKQAPAAFPLKQEPAPAKEFHMENAHLPLVNDLHGNYEKKDWMPSQPMEQKQMAPSHIPPAPPLPKHLAKDEPRTIQIDLQKGQDQLHQIENKEIGEAKSTFEKIRDKTSDMIHEGMEKLNEAVHHGIDKLKGEEEHPIKKEEKPIQKEQLPIQKEQLPIKKEEKPIQKQEPAIRTEEQPIIQQAAPELPIKEEKHIENQAEEKPIEAQAEEKEPELDIVRVLRHSKTKEIFEQEQLLAWKHQKDEKELQSLAGEAAESVKARVMPNTRKTKAAQIAEQAAMLEAARGLTRLSKGAECDHEVVLHGKVDFEYMARLEQLAEDPKKIEKEITIEEVRKSEDFGVPEIFRANITRLASTSVQPTGVAAPQKILSLKKKEKRDARLAKKKQLASIQAQQPAHTKLTQPPIDISLPPLENKIKEKQLEGFSVIPVDSSIPQSSLERTGKASPHTPKHSMEEGSDLLGKPIIKASTAHLQPLTSKAPRRKHYFKQIHKKEETEEQGEKLTQEIPKKLKNKDNKKLSLAERFKEKVMGSFEMAKDKVNEGLELVRGDSGSIMDAAKEKFEHVKERAAEKFEQVKDSAIMEATMEKFEHAKERMEHAKDKVMDTVGWIKEKFAPAAADGIKVGEPNEPEAKTEELKPVPLSETGQFETKHPEATARLDKAIENKEQMKERINF